LISDSSPPKLEAGRGEREKRRREKSFLSVILTVKKAFEIIGKKQIPLHPFSPSPFLLCFSSFLFSFSQKNVTNRRRAVFYH